MKTQKENLANIQPFWPWAWSIISLQGKLTWEGQELQRTQTDNIQLDQRNKKKCVHNARLKINENLPHMPSWPKTQTAVFVQCSWFTPSISHVSQSSALFLIGKEQQKLRPCRSVSLKFWIAYSMLFPYKSNINTNCLCTTDDDVLVERNYLFSFLA